MKRILSVMAVLCCVVSLSGFAAETVYKWKDESGTVHFSDRPVRDADAEEIRVTPSQPADDGESDATDDTEDAASDEGDAGKAPAKGDRQAEVEKQQKKLREQNCQMARQTLEHNESIGRMYRVDANGERVFLSDEEREMVLNSSRKDVENWCK